MHRKKDIISIEWVDHMRCTTCLEYYPYDSYPIRKERNQPYRACMKCRAAKSAKWRENNPHKVTISQKNYRIIHRDEVRERRKAYTKKYYEANKERIKAEMRAYSKTPRHYENTKRRWREWYDIGDNVMFNGLKFKIVGIRPCVWYVIQRWWLAELTVPRKKLIPIKRPEW